MKTVFKFAWVTVVLFLFSTLVAIQARPGPDLPTTKFTNYITTSAGVQIAPIAFELNHQTNFTVYATEGYASPPVISGILNTEFSLYLPVTYLKSANDRKPNNRYINGLLNERNNQENLLQTARQ